MLCAGKDLSSIPNSAKHRLQKSSTHRPWRFCIGFCVRKATWMKKLIFGMLCSGADLMSIPISTKYQLQASRIDSNGICRFYYYICVAAAWMVWILNLNAPKLPKIHLQYCSHRTELTDSSILRHDYYWTNELLDERNEQRPYSFVLCSTQSTLDVFRRNGS